jgi:uncharacterized membrane protein YgdD (TMEM256/DUF423 family)
MDDGRPWLLAAAAFGFLAVCLGAFGAHALNPRLDPYEKGIWQTATQYLMFHSVALACTGLAARGRRIGSLRMSGGAFVCGNLLFAGSLYLIALTDLGGLAVLTPVGGAAYLVGWAALFWSFLRTAR